MAFYDVAAIRVDDKQVVVGRRAIALGDATTLTSTHIAKHDINAKWANDIHL